MNITLVDSLFLPVEKKKGSGILSKIAGHIDIDVSLCKCSAFCDMKLSGKNELDTDC